MTIPKCLNGFYVSPVAANTAEKWIIGVIGQDILLANNADIKATRLLAVMLHNSWMFLQRKITLGQWLSRDCEVWDLTPEADSTDGFNTAVLRDLLAIAGEEVFL